MNSENFRVLPNGDIQTRADESSEWVTVVALSSTSQPDIMIWPPPGNGLSGPAPRRSAVTTSEMNENRALREQADLIGLLGDEALLLEARLAQFQAEEQIKEREKATAAVAVPMHANEAVEAKKAAKTDYPHFDEYRQWLNDEIHFMHKTLVDLYGDENVSIDDKVVKFTETEKNMINREYSSTRKNVNSFSLDLKNLLNKISVEFVVKFPEINITNSSRQKHTIRDLYIVMQITCLMRFQGSFRGLRGIKSLAEYHTNYGHSHMSRGAAPNGTQQFCLGSTEFSNLVHRLVSEPYDRLRFELFVIQLKDYLAWESLEGGPYCRIGEIRVEGNRRQNRFQAPDATQLNNYYKLFLQKYSDTDIQIEDNGYNLLIKINKDRDLWDKITSITPQVHRLPYDDVRGTTYEPPPDESHLWNDINSINRQLIGQNFGVKFKGLDIKTQLEVPAKPKEEDKKTYMAHESVLNHIAQQLETRLNEQLQNEFCKVS